MNPQFPIYIVSKGRWDSRLTMKCLDRLGVPFRVVVEESEAQSYARVLGGNRLLVLDPKLQRTYETCDDLGDTKSRGAGPARNFAWEHAIAEGHDWHWVMDDNIRSFFRFNNCHRWYCGDGTLLRSCEDFVLRYQNVGMAGPHYKMFVNPNNRHRSPFVLNTRIYSCNLIRNDLPFRWRGRYNEDTLLSLDLLTHGWCTILFYHLLQDKIATQLMTGGNTDEIYKEGTSAKSEMLVREYPRYAHLMWRFGRPHHFMNYTRHFGRRPRLKRKPDVEITPGIDDYGLKLVDISEAATSPPPT